MNPCAPVLLVFLLVIGYSADAAILEANGSYQSCRCMKYTSEFIHPKRYESLEIIPLGRACRITEIIVKLKKGNKVCVNPDAPWMKKLLSNLQRQKEQRTLTQNE